ncbi:hypothetical protein JMJ35_008270 [Cladonia borealis]|uniref:Uncharacterized protein n=1 Tax=Cladonia borealis TaxID=184061 RepID=A0AA39QV40_9LECA|nr:hypothetical protein JMJ35_008270 [Cladonia borealis]
MYFSSITTLALLASTAFASTCNKTPSSSNPTLNTLAIYTPGQNQIVPVDRPFTITWDPTAGISTVSIVLLVGPSTNVVPLSCIINSTPNTGTFIWTPPSSLTPTGNSGYGLQIIDDATGEFQYSTQFGISNPEISSSVSSSSTSASTAGGTQAATQLSDGQIQVPTSASHSGSVTAKSSPATTHITKSQYAISASSILVILPSSHSKNRTTTKPAKSTHYTSKPQHIGTGIVSGGAKNSTRFITPTASLTKPSSLGPVTSVVVASQTSSAVEVATSATSAAPATTTTGKSEAVGGRGVNPLLTTFLTRNIVEDYPNGYPRFSALSAACSSFQIYRRFRNVRSRLLLLKQDEIAELELKLDEIDRTEPRPIFLGSRRRDANPERKQVLARLDAALADYDHLIERSNRVLGLDTALTRDVTSIRNYLKSGDLARGETAYLEDEKDLFYVTGARNNELRQLQPVMEGLTRGLCRVFGKSTCEASRDPSIYIPSVSLMTGLARALIAWIVGLLLVVPITVVNVLESFALRLIVIEIFSAVLIIAMSMFTKAKVAELFICGATYAAVLVVFVSGNASHI